MAGPSFRARLPTSIASTRATTCRVALIQLEYMGMDGRNKGDNLAGVPSWIVLVAGSDAGGGSSPGIWDVAFDLAPMGG